MVLAQYTGHKLFSEHEIIEEIDWDIPSLLGCKEASEDRVGMGLRIFIGGLHGTERPFNDQTLLSEFGKPFALLDEILPVLDDRIDQVWNRLSFDDYLLFHSLEGVISNREPFANRSRKPVGKPIELIAHMLLGIDDHDRSGNPNCLPVLPHPEG